jgi:hypothetical protein
MLRTYLKIGVSSEVKSVWHWLCMSLQENRMWKFKFCETHACMHALTHRAIFVFTTTIMSYAMYRTAHWSSNSGVIEDSGLLGCVVVLLGKCFVVFQRNMWSSLQRISGPWTWECLKIWTICFFKTPSTTYQVTQCHIPADQNTLSLKCQCLFYHVSEDRRVRITGHCFCPPVLNCV